VQKATFVLSSGLGLGGREIIPGFRVDKNHFFPHGDRPLGEERQVCVPLAVIRAAPPE
jgi:hypothetical protein